MAKLSARSQSPRYLKLISSKSIFRNYSLLCAGLLSTIAVYYLVSKHSIVNLPWRVTSNLGGSSPLFSADLSANSKLQPEFPNLWRDLNEEEINDVVETVSTLRISSGIHENATIMFIERLRPNKTDVLETITETTGGDIDQWARVVFYDPASWGKTSSGGISEWMVGPILKDETAKMYPLNYIYNSGRNYISKPIPMIDQVWTFLTRTAKAELGDLLIDLLGKMPDFEIMAKTPGLMGLSSPISRANSNSISAWMTIMNFEFANMPDAFSLLAQGLYAHIVLDGAIPDRWNVDAWYYNGVLYNSSQAIHQAWKSGTLQRTIPNQDGPWTNSEPDEDGVLERETLGPMLVQPNGPRFTLNKDQNWVSWMGWDFYLSFNQVTSVSLFFLKFKGERIAYEISLQEALAHYAGSSPSMAGQAFFDSLFGFGTNNYGLVPGYDCPAYATYLPVTWYREVSDHALQRHTTTAKVTASRNHYLVVRSVATLGNYDYTISYIFYLDGSIEVKVHASGYIFSDYMALENMRQDLANSGASHISEYGYRVHDTVIASIHTHELMFKADLDIVGTSNTLYKTSVEPMRRKYSFEEEERNTMHLVHEAISNEAGLDWSSNSKSIYVLLNEERENSWGEKRGYKIVPGTGMGTPPHLQVTNSTAIGKSAEWAYHNLWVLKNHDHEVRGASEWNAWEPLDPLIDFGKMVNGENTVQDDLVLYFNLGVHHLSNSQDIPNTLMNWAGTSIMFIPHNYFDRDPSRQSAQGVKLSKGNSGKTSVTYYGAKLESDISFSKNDVEPDLSNYEIPADGIVALSMNKTHVN